MAETGDVRDVDAVARERSQEWCVTEGKDTPVRTDDVVAPVVVRRHDTYDGFCRRDVDARQRTVEPCRLPRSVELEHPTVRTGEVVA